MSGALLISNRFLKVIQLFERNHKRKKYGLILHKVYVRQLKKGEL